VKVKMRKGKMRKGDKKTTRVSPRASIVMIDEAEAIRISARQQVEAETKGRSTNQDSGPARRQQVAAETKGRSKISARQQVAESSGSRSESGRRGARDSAEESPEESEEDNSDLWKRGGSVGSVPKGAVVENVPKGAVVEKGGSVGSVPKGAVVENVPRGVVVYGFIQHTETGQTNTANTEFQSMGFEICMFAALDQVASLVAGVCRPAGNPIR
jgi:hypothetical protein